MRAPLTFLWLWGRCVAFLWVGISLIILGLFAVGHEAEGYSWAERLGYAVRYGFYVASVFGTLLAIMIGWQSWRTERRNAKILARRDKTS
jgi:hypothetical protein